ncbi:hypothetical protein EDB80DRAFT_811554 [Ilyonectria destructans]|nr:hypothetical protein EDB80DRAFT_811554 [Ilyonectria destructans]
MKVLTVLPNVSSAFQDQLAQDKQAFDRATFLEYERRSVGECFRAALTSWWQRRELEEITERLDKRYAAPSPPSSYKWGEEKLHEKTAWIGLMFDKCEAQLDLAGLRI